MTSVGERLESNLKVNLVGRCQRMQARAEESKIVGLGD